MHAELTPVNLAWRHSAKSYARNPKPESANARRNDGGWRVEGEEGQKHRHENRRSIQLPGMLWEQALLRTVQAQFPRENRCSCDYRPGRRHGAAQQLKVVRRTQQVVPTIVAQASAVMDYLEVIR
jgi:hypothetical protein